MSSVSRWSLRHSVGALVLVIVGGIMLSALFAARAQAQAPAPEPCATPTIRGTAGNDLGLIGTPGNDVIAAGAGNDIIDGGGGDDVICGDDGDDLIAGSAGNDRISGGAGNDRMTGDEGNDTLNGDDGNDLADGGAGTDACEAETKLNCEGPIPPPGVRAAMLVRAPSAPASPGPGSFYAVYDFNSKPECETFRTRWESITPFQAICIPAAVGGKYTAYVYI